MRPVICALGTLLCVFSELSGADLTVVLDFENEHSATSVAEMKVETERLLAASSVSVDWRTASSFLAGESFPKLAVIKLKGRCELTPLAPPAPANDEPLGSTYRIEGSITPFAEVQCDRIRGTLGAAHMGAASGEGDTQFGRALGRVLAHELFHIWNGNSAHTQHGVTQRYLSATKLVEGTR